MCIYIYMNMYIIYYTADSSGLVRAPGSNPDGWCRAVLKPMQRSGSRTAQRKSSGPCQRSPISRMRLSHARPLRQKEKRTSSCQAWSTSAGHLPLLDASLPTTRRTLVPAMYIYIYNNMYYWLRQYVQVLLIFDAISQPCNTKRRLCKNKSIPKTNNDKLSTNLARIHQNKKIYI